METWGGTSISPAAQLLHADHVEGHEGEPVDGVDAVGEEDEPGLVEAARTLPRLEGVQRGGDDQEEGEEEPGDEACVHTCNDSPCNISALWRCNDE